MKSTNRAWFWFLFLSLTASATIEAQPVITELVANNGGSLLDEYLEPSDWIEIYAGETAVDLTDWYLSDDPSELTKWRFPPTNLDAGGYLILFASGKDRVGGEYLHTNFRLNRGGESILLVQPDGTTVASSFEFPAQVDYASFGARMPASSDALIEDGTTATFFVPQNDELALTWTQNDFDDSSWLSGPLPLGYDQSSTPAYNDVPLFDVSEQMRGVNSSAYLRIEFDVADPDVVDAFLVSLRYDDGLALYLNGEEVLRRNAPSDLRWNSRATRSRAASDALRPDFVNMSSSVNLLRPGTNVLACHLLNFSQNHRNVLFWPHIESRTLESVDVDEPNYFDEPTPGWLNGVGFPGVASSIEFSLPTTLSAEPQQVTLSFAPGNEVHYTTNGQSPTLEAPLYTGSITVDNTMRVQARAFQEGLLPGPIAREEYVLIDPLLLQETSDVPLVVVATFGRGVSGSFATPGSLFVFDRGDDGRAALTKNVDYAGDAAFKVRGSSTGSRAKFSLSVELRDNEGDDFDAEILGMPPESDWVLYGAFNFDRALMRNAFIYELSNRIGRYATRTRFCEVYVLQSSQKLTSGNYFGVYSFCEKIKRGPDRVDVEALEPTDVTEPNITGGYIFKIDRLDPGDTGFSAGGQTMGHVYPKESIIEQTPEQQEWLKDFVNRFAASLRSPDFDNPETGYASFIDVDGWIDHHLLNVLALNVDALRLSTYMHKYRSGKFIMGPIWDFDRSMGSTDGRDANPIGWSGTGDATPFFTYPWWRDLFRDPAFWERYMERWFELRQGEFSTGNIHNLIDGMALEIAESSVRNYARWRSAAPPSLEFAVDRLKTWLARRVDWIDSQFIDVPEFVGPTGEVPSGSLVDMRTTEGKVIYTINGPDPRPFGEDVSPEAVEYDGQPLVIVSNQRIRARTFVENKGWSDLVTEFFITDPLPLVITEIMYNPPRGETTRTVDFEYLELFNRSDRPIELAGAGFSTIPLFQFDPETSMTLGPNEYIVLPANNTFFAERYGEDGIRIGGTLGRGALRNTGQRIELLGPLGETIADFVYDDDWFPETDGEGYSLVLRDPTTPATEWSSPASWRASFERLGSPGREDLPASDGRQLPGDFTQDRKLNIADAIGVLRHLFAGVSVLPCDSEVANQTLLDVNGDNKLDGSDALYTLRYLFSAASPAAVLGTECVSIPECPSACFGQP